MRVLVTGGAGFIGSNLVRALLARDHEVRVIDDLSTGHRENLPSGVKLVEADILGGELHAAFRAFAPHVVVHLAAQASVPVSIADPEYDRRVNVEGTRAVAQAAVAAGARRVISASSAAVYGEPAELPLVESSPKHPANPYGHSKLAAEDALADVCASGGTDYASFRFANVYGPFQDAAGEGGVVALFLDAIASGELPLIYGDGEQTRDFIFVGDVAAAVITALEAPAPLASAGPSFNISTGERTSVNDLLAAARAASGYEGDVTRLPARVGDVLHSALDSARAQRAFGWSPEVGLAQGIRETWTWYEALAR